MLLSRSWPSAAIFIAFQLTSTCAVAQIAKTQKIQKPIVTAKDMDKLTALPVQTTGRMVQASFLRMHSPGAVAGMMKGGKRSSMVNSFFPSHMRDMALRSGTALGSEKRWGQLSDQFAAQSATIKFGTQFQNAEGVVASQVFEGVGSHDGVLTLDLNGLNTFKVTKAYTTTGELDNSGNPIVKDVAIKVTGNRLKVNIFEGQSYFVEAQMPLDKTGSLLGKMIADDGTKSEISLGGVVNAVKGKLSGSFLSPEFSMTAGSSVEAQASIHTNGPVDPKINWVVTQNPGNFDVDVPSDSFAKKDNKVVTFRLKRYKNYTSGIFPVTIEGSGFNGTSKISLTTTVEVKAVWVDIIGTGSWGKVQFTGSTDGDYCVQMDPSATCNLAYGTYFAPVAYCVQSNGGWFGSGGSSSYNFIGKNFNLSELKYKVVVGNDPYLTTHLVYAGNKINGVGLFQGKSMITKMNGGYGLPSSPIHELK